MKRIYWSKEAKQAIACRSFEHMTYGMTDLQAVRKAMSEELPADQQRDIYAMSVVSKWLLPMWDEIRESGASRFAKQRVNPMEIPEVTPEQAPTALSLQDVPVAALIGELVSRMERAMDPAVWEERIRVQVNACLDRRLPGILPADPLDSPKAEPVKPEPEAEAEEPTKAAKPRVLVIGLLPGQQKEIARRFSNVIFYHVDGDASENRVRSLAANMDLTIRTHWSNGMDLKRIPRVLNVQGSMSSIYRQLEQWLADRSK